MKNKAILGIFLAFSGWLFLFGQVGKKYYYKKNFPVTATDDYDTFGIIDSIGTNGLFYATFFYNLPDNPVKLYGAYSDEFLTREEDTLKYYHKNGTLKSIIPYQAGKPKGIAKYYYDNGKPKSEKNYDFEKPNEDITLDYLYMNSWKKDGTLMIKEGNGEISEHMFDEDDSKSFGKVKNGLRQGEWYIDSSLNNSHFILEYDDGKVVNSIWIDSLGNKKPYDYYVKKSIYNYINKNLGTQLTDNINPGVIKRPYYLRVKFIINDKGTLDNIEISNTAPPKIIARIEKALYKIKLDPKITNQRLDINVPYGIPIRLKSYN